MRGIRLLAFVAAWVSAVGCSSSATMGGAGGQGAGGIGGNGAGGNGQGGGAGHDNGMGGNTGAVDGGGKDSADAGSGGQTGAGGQSGIGGQSGTGGQGGMGGSDCNPACGAGSVCVGTGIQGGAVFPPDAGVCPQGRHLEGNICLQDLTFACRPIPSGCSGTATCACASSLCTADGGTARTCGMPRPGELTCILFVP